MIKKIKCLFIKHILLDSQFCPFTGKNYISCLRCGVTIAK